MSKPETGGISNVVPAAGNGARNGHGQPNALPVTMTSIFREFELENHRLEQALNAVEAELAALRKLHGEQRRKHIDLLMDVVRRHG